MKIDNLVREMNESNGDLILLYVRDLCGEKLHFTRNDSEIKFDGSNVFSGLKGITLQKDSDFKSGFIPYFHSGIYIPKGYLEGAKNLSLDMRIGEDSIKGYLSQYGYWRKNLVNDNQNWKNILASVEIAKRRFH